MRGDLSLLMRGRLSLWLRITLLVVMRRRSARRVLVKVLLLLIGIMLLRRWTIAVRRRILKLLWRLLLLLLLLRLRLRMVSLLVDHLTELMRFGLVRISMLLLMSKLRLLRLLLQSHLLLGHLTRLPLLLRMQRRLLVQVLLMPPGTTAHGWHDIGGASFAHSLFYLRVQLAQHEVRHVGIGPVRGVRRHGGYVSVAHLAQDVIHPGGILLCHDMDDNDAIN